MCALACHFTTCKSYTVPATDKRLCNPIADMHAMHAACDNNACKGYSAVLSKLSRGLVSKDINQKARRITVDIWPENTYLAT